MARPRTATIISNITRSLGKNPNELKINVTGSDNMSVWNTSRVNANNSPITTENIARPAISKEPLKNSLATISTNSLMVIMS